MTQMNYRGGGQNVSMAAMVAIVAALGSFFLSCSGRGVFGLVAAIVGVIFGFLGFMRAASPRVRGGMISLAAIGLSVVALVPAILAMLGKMASYL
jgi:hypothetical protein